MSKKLLFSLFILLFFLLIPCVVNGEEVEFKPINYLGDIKVDSHYIITTYNENNNNWYALGCSENGEAISVPIANPQNGLKITSNKSDISNFHIASSAFGLKYNQLDNIFYYVKNSIGDKMLILSDAELLYISNEVKE